MLSLRLVILSTLLVTAWGSQGLDFPPGFKFGAASASYQVEGAWNVSDKTPSIWDTLVHERPELISDRSSGDVACDSYHQWERDIEMAVELGLDFYRFSISWPRLLPNGFDNYISEDGKNYYNKLIDGLLDKGIEPLVSIYHWDLPQSLQDLGGWSNPLISDWFADYSRVVYTLYADRVKTWITINEPIIVCDLAFNTGSIAPAIANPDVAPYICNKNILMAHAKAWRIYDEDFRPKHRGEVSLANQLLWIEALTPEHEELAEALRENMGGRYSHPIFSKEGGWPPVIEKIMEENSKRKGYSKSTFPAFSEEEKAFVRGTFDFYAVNHYTSRLARDAEPGEDLGAWPLLDCPDLNAKLLKHSDWPPTTSSWFYVNPPGLRRQLVWLKEKYGDIKFLITENGHASGAGIRDTARVLYYRDYLEQVLLAIKEDGVNVTAYTAWTLMDNFEWMDGYESKFGLYEVDFDSPLRTRTPRDSARYYKSVIQQHRLVEPVVPLEDET